MAFFCFLQILGRSRAPLHPRELFRPPVRPAVDIFILPAALQHNLIIGVALDTPHQPLAGRKAFAELALFRWDVNFPEFIGKITVKPAEMFAVVFVIADAEKLPAAEYPKVEYGIV